MIYIWKIYISWDMSENYLYLIKYTWKILFLFPRKKKTISISLNIHEKLIKYTWKIYGKYIFHEICLKPISISLNMRLKTACILLLIWHMTCVYPPPHMSETYLYLIKHTWKIYISWNIYFEDLTLNEPTHTSTKTNILFFCACIDIE
jgi:hypothetical protein